MTTEEAAEVARLGSDINSLAPPKKNEAIASFFFIQAAGLAYHPTESVYHQGRLAALVSHARARSPFARWHSVLRSVFDGTLARAIGAWFPRASTDSLTLDYHAPACIPLRLDDIIKSFEVRSLDCSGENGE